MLTLRLFASGETKMESNAIEFTNRILTKRFEKFTGHGLEVFFETSKSVRNITQVIDCNTS